MALLYGVLAAVLVLAGLLYWLLVTTEGTYLGPRVVTLLYDWTAKRYDAIKNVQYVHEARFLGLPLAEALGGVDRPFVLDIATGTGRLPMALLMEPDFDGVIVGVDRSIPMLGEAVGKVAVHVPQVDGPDLSGGWGTEQCVYREGCPPGCSASARTAFAVQDAHRLGFVADCFDAVACLEALEFMGDPSGVLREAVRVLRPGGLFFCSVRVGRDAPFFPGRLCGRGRLEAALEALGLTGVSSRRWQADYDLVCARKKVY